MADIPFNETRPFRLVKAIHDLQEGRTRATGDFTIRHDNTTTVVTDPLVRINDVILLMATSATSAIEQSLGLIYVSDVAAGEFTVTHSDDPDETRTFRYLVAGE